MDTGHEERILRGRLSPPVKSLRLAGEGFFEIKDGAVFEIASPCGAHMARPLAKQFWNVDIALEENKSSAPAGIPREGYRISVSAGKAAIAASSEAGIRYAFSTLRQIAESRRGCLSSEKSFFLPELEIEDAPDMPFRGMHLCFFPLPETRYDEMERNIRLAAYYKFNYVVIEAWGSLKYPSHPEFSWNGHSIEAGELRRLVRLAKELGICPVPQLNIFGHASCARMVTGKHVLLDQHPEYAPLFEPDGWCWCLSNPHTRQFILDLVNDLVEIFGNPPFFHLGCDEAEGAGSCMLCRRSDYSRLLKEHLLFFGDFLKSKGARPMIWHDMFAMRGLDKFKGYVALGTEETVKVLKDIPKDFVICDWRYNYQEEDFKTGSPTWATYRHFMELGFDTLGCPWCEIANLQGFGKEVKRAGGMGLLETTWQYNTGWDMYGEFYHGARAAWNPDSEDCWADGASPGASFNRHLREIHRDMGLTGYENYGSSRFQIHGPHFNRA